MFERLQRLYECKAISKDGLKKAVKNKLITPEEYEKITGEVYDG